MPNVQHATSLQPVPEAAPHSRSNAFNANATRDASNNQIPQLSINGGLLPSQSPTSRQPKSPVIEIDNAWGANFWVTLIEPQVRFAGLFSLATNEANSYFSQII